MSTDPWYKRKCESEMATNTQLKRLMRELERAEVITDMWEDAWDLTGDDALDEIRTWAFDHEYMIKQELKSKLMANAYYRVDGLDVWDVIENHREELRRWIYDLP